MPDLSFSRPEAHLWYLDPTSPTGDALFSLAPSLMSPDERERDGRITLERVSREHRVTRAFCRIALGRYTRLPPASLSFSKNEHGCPSLALDDAPRFNLSHTEGLITLLVSRTVDVGVDVEPRDRKVDANLIADRYFSPLEASALRRLPPHRHLARFLDLWTLKESYIKACGMGLAIPLDSFSFLLDEAPPIRIAFDGRDDDPAWWQFEQPSALSSHIVSVAFKRPPDTPVALSCAPFDEMR